MTQETAVRRRAVPAAQTLQLWAGRLMVGIALLHAAFFSVLTWRDWDAWASGALWGDNPITTGQPRLHVEFWALPGSFTVPVLLLGLLVIRLVRRGVAIPGYVGWGLLAWAVGCAALVEPSGFPLGLAPSLLLIVADRKRLRATPPGAAG